MLPSHHPPEKLPKSRKLPPAFAPLAFSFYMAGIMAFLMCLVIICANEGFGPGYFSQVLDAYAIAMPTAFIFVLSVKPLVVALVKWTVET